MAAFSAYVTLTLLASAMASEKTWLPPFGQELPTTQSPPLSANDIDSFLRRMYSTRPDNCSMESLGPGIVQQLASDRFKRQALIAVTRANLLTYLWKYNPDYLYRESVLYWLVSNLVESDNNIFAAGNCYDLNQFKSFGIFCPYAFRNKKDQSIVVKDLAKTHQYDNQASSEHEWFHVVKQIGLEIIKNSKQREESVVHFYLPNDNVFKNYSTLIVNYEDGHWSMPYYDCGGGNIWMITYTIPFFGYDRLQRSYTFKGTSGIDIDLMQLDINQCSADSESIGEQNIFAGTHKCRPSTSCSPVTGFGFQRGSYNCLCRDGYYFPMHLRTDSAGPYFFNGSEVEEAYDKKRFGNDDSYDVSFECIPCQPGCDTCEDDRPCLFPINWPLRWSLLCITIFMMCTIGGWSAMIKFYRQYKPVVAACPLLLQIILAGALLSYTPMIINFFEPNPFLCTLQFWPREIGFAIIYASILFKTWRIAVVFQPAHNRNVKITDVMLLQKIAIVVAVAIVYCSVRTIFDRPGVEMVRHSSGLKTFTCRFDVWDYGIAAAKLLFLLWGVWLSILVRKTPSEFNESKFISWAIYNETILTIFFNISMFFLHHSGNPDLHYILLFLHLLLTVTGTIAFLFATKAYQISKVIKTGETTGNRRFVTGLNVSGAKPSRIGSTFASPSLIESTCADLSKSSHSPHVNGTRKDTNKYSLGNSVQNSTPKIVLPQQPNSESEEEQLLLPRISKLQAQLDSLRYEFSQAKMAEQNETPIHHPEDEKVATKLAVRCETVLEECNGITREISSLQSQMSCNLSNNKDDLLMPPCKSPISSSTSTFTSTSATAKTSGSDIVENHVNGNVSPFSSDDDKQCQDSVPSNTLNGVATENGISHDDIKTAGQHEANGKELDTTVVSREEGSAKCHVINGINGHQTTNGSNGVPLWVKQNGKHKNEASASPTPKRIPKNGKTDSDKNVVNCVQFTYV